MQTSQRATWKLLALSLMLQASLAHAQEDFGGDFNPPPPPPPPAADFSNSGGGSFTSPPPAPTAARGGMMGSSPMDPNSGGNNASKDAAEPGGALNKAQKEKFATANIEDINDKNFPETIESFDFPNADIQDIVKAISELTGKNFIIDNGLRGKITIVAPSKITVAEAYKAFLSALAINGYAVVPSGKFLKIRSARNAQRDSIETYSGTYYPNSDQMITRIIHLKHISADAVNRDLRILTSKDGEFSVYTPTNSLIMSDYGANIDRVMKIIEQLDVPGFDDQLEVIPVRYAKAKDIADLISKIVNKGQTNNNGGLQGGFNAGVPRFTRPFGATTTNQQGSAYYMVFPDDRTNSLIVVGNKAGIARIKKLLTQLDFRLRPEDAGGVYVYYMKYGDAEKIAATLSGVTKDAAPKPTSGAGAGPLISPISGVQTAQQEIFGGDVKVTADKGTNSLVVVASKQDYEVVLNLLRRIDIPRDQVYVQSIIMEMNSTDSADYKIGYYKYVGTSGAKIGFNGFQQADLLGLLNPVGGTGTILGFGSGDKVTITPPATAGGTAVPMTISSLIGFINFLKSTQNANILSTPQILALDAQEAELEVGEKVITSVNAVAGQVGAPVSTPVLEDATIHMKLKPYISPTSNSIRMELDTQVKQIANASIVPAQFVGLVQPLATRHIKTNIVVRNGDTAVLGGLMKDTDTEIVTKVPLLGDIPIIGWLFKSRSSQKAKSNLLVFMTPKVIRSPSDQQQLLGEKMDERLRYIKQTGGRDPFGEEMDHVQKRKASTDKAGSVRQ